MAELILRWKSSDYRSKTAASVYCDGRCFHCDRPIVSFDEPRADPRLRAESLPLDVDHAIPHAFGGADSPTNYLAACFHCNRSRQETPLEPAQMQRARELWEAVSLASIIRLATEVERCQKHIYLPSEVCAEHGWHIQSSPAARKCRSEVRVEAWPGLIRNEWLPAFGHRSQEVLDRLRGSRVWANPLYRQAVVVALPRIAARSLDYLDEYLACSDYFELNSLPGVRFSLHPTAGLTLEATNSHAMSRASDQNLTRHLGSLFASRYEFEWPQAMRLWASRGWPTYLLYEGIPWIPLLTRSQRSTLLAELRIASTAGEAEAVLLRWATRGRLDGRSVLPTAA